MIKLCSDGTVEVEAQCFLIVVQEGPLEEFIKKEVNYHFFFFFVSAHLESSSLIASKSTNRPKKPLAAC